jgi:HEAT repeat protein
MFRRPGDRRSQGVVRTLTLGVCAAGGLASLTGCHLVSMSTPGLAVASPPATTRKSEKPPVATAVWRQNAEWSPFDLAAGKPPHARPTSHWRWQPAPSRSAQLNPIPAPDDQTILAARKNAGRTLRGSRPPTSQLAELKRIVVGPRSLPETSPAWLSKLTGEPKSRNAAPPGHEETPLPTRQAAAEAWCALVVASGETESLLPSVTETLEDSTLPDHVRFELWRGIAPVAAPVEIPGLVSRLQAAAGKASAGRVESSNPAWNDTFVAVLETCIIHAVHRTAYPRPVEPHHIRNVQPGDEQSTADKDDGVYPMEIWQAQWHDDPRVRRRFGEWLAITRPPEGFDILRRQLQDQSPTVSEAALVSLGVWGGADAAAELQKAAQRPEDRYRVFAVRGLSLDPAVSLQPFVRDTAASVRCEAARRLAERDDPASLRLLAGLLTDANLDVQLTSVAGIDSSKHPAATALLLRSLAESSGFKTRQTALEALRRRRGELLLFPLEAPPAQRMEIVSRWRRDWNVSDWQLETEVALLAVSQEQRLIELRSHEIRDRLAARAAATDADSRRVTEAWFRGLTNDDLSACELALESAAPDQRHFLLNEVLPRLNTEYDALARCRHVDVQQRRKASSELMRMGRSASLRSITLHELAAMLPRESDTLVWRQVLAAVADDATEPAARLARLAIQNAWPDIRVLGCEYVGRQARPHHAAWLRPALADPSEIVQIAAANAAARCRNPALIDDVPGESGPQRGLRSLLASPNAAVRNAAVLALGVMGDETGARELIRIANDQNSTQRLAAIAAMGDSGQSRYVDPLIQLAWVETHHQTRITALENLERLVPESGRPTGLDGASPERKATRWAEWLRERTPTASGSSKETR